MVYLLVTNLNDDPEVKGLLAFIEDVGLVFCELLQRLL